MLAALDGRHALGIFLGGDALDQPAFAGLARDNGETAVAQRRERAQLRIQAELGLPLILVRSMAGEAVLR